MLNECTVNARKADLTITSFSKSLGLVLGSVKCFTHYFIPKESTISNLWKIYRKTEVSPAFSLLWQTEGFNNNPDIPHDKFKDQCFEGNELKSPLRANTMLWCLISVKSHLWNSWVKEIFYHILKNWGVKKKPSYY